MYQGVRSQIIIVNPLPLLDQVYNMILKEEAQRFILAQTQPLTESTTMAIRKNKSDIICFHYGKSGHVKAQCYRLIGFPPDFKFTKSKSSVGGIKAPMVHQVTGFDSSSSSNASEHNSQLNLSKDQVQKLMMLLAITI